MTDKHKPFTLDDYNKMMRPIYEEIATHEAKRLIELKDDYHYYGGVQYSHWQRFKFKLDRIKDAWLVLIGRKVAVDE